eukprot:9102723-Ditylum_brightwellii.AAC.1
MAAMGKSIDDLTAALTQLRHGADASAGLGNRNEEEAKFYCWTHGAATGKWHTSKNCKKPKDGHKENATYYNRMGRSDNLPQPSYRRRI